MEAHNNENSLFSFFLLGCEWAKLCQANMLYYDLHKDNILFRDDGDFAIVDIDDCEFVEFPTNIEKYANGLINLYINFGMELGSAFRYGFLNVTGETGEVLYDIMYNRHELTALDFVGKPRQIDMNAENLTKKYIEWTSCTNNSFVKKITNDTYRYAEFSYIELMERNVDEFHKYKDIYIDNINLIGHEYRIYFANGLFSGNDFDTASAALTLVQVEFHNQNYFLSAYYFLVVKEILAENEEYVVTLQEEVQYATAMFVLKFGAKETERLFEYILHETVRIRMQRNTLFNYFYEIWYWTDFGKEKQIKDYMKERNYGCYKCSECNNIGFFDGEIKCCESCGHENPKIISLQKYVELKIDIIENENNDNSHKSNFITGTEPDIPILNKIDLIPLYIQYISVYQKNEEYQQAIKLALIVETFLKNNKENCDEKGYVIEKAGISRNIFFNPMIPYSLMKLFLFKNDYVKNDYESFICYKLCQLYEQDGDCEMALMYADRLIDLANNSRRWLLSSYVEYAYSVKKEYYDNQGIYNEALSCANILFTYSILQRFEKDFSEHSDMRETKHIIELLKDISKSNADAGNIALSYSCCTLALRMHIYHYGRRHPKSALIYSLIAQLLTSKKVYEEAYALWGASLMLLENNRIKRYNKQISEIEASVLKCLSKAGYNGSLQDWKKEWMTENAFKVFTEKQFEKQETSGNSIPKTELSKEEIFDNYIVYNP